MKWAYTPSCFTIIRFFNSQDQLVQNVFSLCLQSIQADEDSTEAKGVCLVLLLKHSALSRVLYPLSWYPALDFIDYPIVNLMEDCSLNIIWIIVAHWPSTCRTRMLNHSARQVQNFLMFYNRRSLNFEWEQICSHAAHIQAPRCTTVKDTIDNKDSLHTTTGQQVIHNSPSIKGPY